MNCPYCTHTETSVVDIRKSEGGIVNRRRRECEKCGKRFTTYERTELLTITVIKKDGRKEPFNREKIVSGIRKACEKRPVTEDRIQEVADDIERKIRRRKSTEIQSREIGEIVMKRLKTLDAVAYVRFASVYREFDDVKKFKDEIKSIT
ncbi:Transcriptional repressor NrdR [uncultured archaeon]|nr:Transcriptional repressor NrdR [uncultured archaeon]